MHITGPDLGGAGSATHPGPVIFPTKGGLEI